MPNIVSNVNLLNVELSPPIEKCVAALNDKYNCTYLLVPLQSTTNI